jgi:hypothetical protein
VESYFLMAGVVCILAFASQVTTRAFAKPELAVHGVAVEGARVKFVRHGALNRRWTVFDFIVVGALVSFSALRFQVGTDYLMYLRTYSTLDPRDWANQFASSGQEAGYTALSLLLRSTSESPYLIFWVAAAITVIPVYATLKKQSDDLTFSILLYVLLAFFVSPFNIVRQGIAIALNFWANTFIEKNKVAFIFINGIAALFHSSVLIVAVIQLLMFRREPRLRTVLFIVGGGVLFAAGILTLPALGEALSTLNPRYGTYIGESSQAAGIGTYFLIAARLGLLIYAMYLGWTESNAKWMTYVAIGVFFLIAGTQSIVASRMEDYFGIFLILLLPNQLAQRTNAVASKIVLLLLSAVYFGLYLQNYGGLIPYQTYLNG